eukprot:4056132-Alexandrium_andersonii.AAC.1
MVTNSSGEALHGSDPLFEHLRNTAWWLLGQIKASMGRLSKYRNTRQPVQYPKAIGKKLDRRTALS